MSDLEAIFAHMSSQPHTLNSSTAQYLALMASPYNPLSMRWEELQEIMNELTNCEDHSKAILLMNALRLVLLETFPTVSIHSNRLYTWLLMHYGVRINNLVEQAAMQEQWEKASVTASYGLGYSQLVIEILEHYCKASPNNRVTIPEFHRFICKTLSWVNQRCQSVPQFIRLPNLGISETHPQPEQEQGNQQQNEEKKQVKQKSVPPAVNLTQLLRIVTHKPKKAGLAPGKIQAAIISKCVQLLRRSIACGRKKVLRQLNFINEEINPILRELIEKIKPNSIKAAEAEPYDMLNEIKLYFRKFGDSLEEVVELQESEEQVQNNIIQVRELTPRFIDEEPAMQIKKLKKKKNKLLKKIESDVRKNTLNRMQEEKVRQDVKNERSHKREKKEIFVLQKQTEEAKKVHKQMKKVKLIEKDSKKDSGKGPKSFGKSSRPSKKR